MGCSPTIERQGDRLIATFSAGIDADLVHRTIEVERERCPFFILAYDTSRRRLSIAVNDAAQEPALNALRYALTASL